MSVTLDKIDVIIERANVSYQEAKEALEAHDGDLVEALIALEKGEKIKKEKNKAKENINEKCESFTGKLGSEIKRLHKHKFRINKEGEQVINIPLTIAILLCVITFPFSFVVLALLLILGYKISFQTKDSEIVVNDFINEERTE